MSPTRDAHPADPATVFLGPNAGAGGPFALLGLDHDTRDPAAIRQAAHRALARIDAHPLRRTPQAEEVRLAVHAAAAQLADPALHAELRRHWPAGTPEPRAVRPIRLHAVSPDLAARARMIVGASGGWNGRAKKRLAHLARLHRVRADDLLRAVRPGDSTPAAKRPPRVPGVQPPRSTGRWWLTVHATLAVLLLVMLTRTALELRQPGRRAGPPVASAPTGPSEPPEVGQASTVPAPREDIEHHATLEQELRNTLSAATIADADAPARLARGLDRFFTRWRDAPPDARQRIADVIARTATELGPRVGIQSLTDQIAAALQHPDPARRAIAAATAAWAAEHADLPRADANRLARLGRFTGQGGHLDERTVAALAALAPSADPDDEPFWRSWSDALAACAGAPEALRARTRMDAIDALLEAPNPADPAAWRRTVARLGAGLSWRPGDPATVWLAERLLDPAANPARLAGLTEALATEISAPGVDPGMVLAPDADQAARAVIADRYRAVWAPRGISPERAEIVERLTEALRDGSGGIDALLNLARLNAAAAMTHQGDAAAAAELLAAPATTTRRPPPAVPPAEGALNDAWALRLLAAETPEDAQALIRDAARARGRTSPLAAEAVVAQALRGEGSPLREAARALVVFRAEDPQIIMAVERAAARRPSASVAALVTAITGVALPPARDDAWLVEVRAALLPIIAARMAEQNPDDRADAERFLAELMAERSGLGPDEPLLRSVLAETDRWLSRTRLDPADPLAPRAVQARRDARASNAAAQAQRVAVEHRALVEAMAGAILSDAGATRARLERTLDELADDWSAADTVLDQILAAHRAEAALWIILMEQSP